MMANQFELYEKDDFIHIYGIKETKSGVVEIPDEINDKPVTRINLFKNVPSLEGKIKEIHIPGSVTEIWKLCRVSDLISVASDNPNYATDGKAIFTKDMSQLVFFSVSETEEYIVPDTVKKISSNAFREHTKLKTITFSDSVSEIGENAFYGCMNLTTVVGGIGITTIEGSAFADTAWLNDGEEKVIGNVFYYQCAVKDGKANRNITIPAGVRTLSTEAFPYQIRTDIQTISLPDSLVHIPRGSLQLPSVKEIHIPCKVKKIENESLPACWSRYYKWDLDISDIAELEAVHVDPDNEYYADQDGVLFSKDLKTLLLFPVNKKESRYAIPEGTETIGAKAFVGNRNITELILPESLCSIEVSDGIGAMAGMQKLRKVTFGNKMAVIPEGTFMSCSQLKQVVFGNSLTEIGARAFADTNITDIGFPETLQSIGSQAFWNSLHGAIISLPDQLEKVGYANFVSCREVTIQDSAHMELPGSISNTVIAVMDSVTNRIKFKVYMCESDEPEKVQDMLKNGWNKRKEFDFISLDGMFSSYKQMTHRLKTAVLRLEYPIDLTEEAEKTYRSFIKRNGYKVLPDLISQNVAEDIRLLVKYGAVTDKNVDSFVEEASKSRNSEVIAMLLECRKTFPDKKAAPKLTLSNTVKEWKTNKADPRLIGRYMGTEEHVTFPSEWEENTIVGTADASGKVSENYLRIKEVIVPEGYTSLGSYSFYGCKELKKIILPSTLISIGDHCFEKCTGLKEIVLPENLTDIGNSAFKGCTSLSTVQFNKALVSIGNEAFCECRKLTAIDLGENVKQLGSHCFWSGSLETVIYRGKYCACHEQMCFSYPRYVYSDGQINALGIPASTIMPLSYIGYRTGEILKKARKDLLNGVTVSGRGELKAFFKDNSPNHNYHDETDLPYFVNQLGGKYSGRLTKKIDICIVADKGPHNEAYQEASASGAAVLTEIEFLDLINGGKIDISEIKKKYLGDTSKPAKKEDKNDPFRPAAMKKLWAYELLEDGSYKLTDYKGKDSEIEVPERIGETPVTKIGARAFSPEKDGRRYDRAAELKQIKTVKLPETIHEIEWGAFWGIDALESIHFSSVLRVIGDFAFCDCRSLKKVELPDSLKIIGRGAFEDCGFTEKVVIPPGIQTIGARAFSGCKCMADEAGFVIFGTTLNSYEGEGGEVTIPGSVTEIGPEAFYRCENLSQIIIPDTVTRIGEHAFSGCKALADINGFVVVKGTLYSYYGDAKEVFIPDEVTAIESQVFWFANEMTKMHISGKVIDIDPNMIGYVTHLKTIITTEGSAAERFAREHKLKIIYEK